MLIRRVRPPSGRVRRRSQKTETRFSSRNLTEGTTESPRFLENPNCLSALFSRLRQGCRHQTNIVPQHGSCGRKKKAPTTAFRRSIAWLSDWLRAQCAARSPSPDGLTTYDARLTSGRWSNSTGRALPPQDSYERFQIWRSHLILLSHATVFADFGQFCLPGRTSRIVATSVNVFVLSSPQASTMCRETSPCGNTKILSGRLIFTHIFAGNAL